MNQTQTLGRQGPGATLHSAEPEQGPTGQRRRPDARPRSLVPVSLLVGWVLVFGAGAIWWFVDPNAQFMVFGGAASFIVTIPVVRTRYNLFSPWTIVLLITYIGCGIRGSFIALGIDDQADSLQSLFLMGHSMGYFLRPSAIYVAAIAVLTAGYMMGERHRGADSQRLGWIQGFRFREAAGPLVLLLALVGFVAFVVYVRQTGGFHLAELSHKRLAVTGGSDSGHTVYGVPRFLNIFSAVAFWIMAARYAWDRRKITYGGRGLVLGLLALNAIALPFYASSRTDAVMILLIGWVIFRAVRPGRVPYRGISLLAIGGLALLGLMTLLRPTGGNVATPTIGFSSVLSSALDGVVYNRNFGDMQVTSDIINAIPSQIPFQHGATIVTWIVAPIPRTIWATKPDVNVGPLIGSTLYNTTNGGVPPGFVADFYLNFGLAGVMVGSLILGLILGRVGRFAAHNGVMNPGAAVLYYPAVFAFANASMQKGIGAGVFSGLEYLVPVAVALLLVGHRQPDAVLDSRS